MSASVHEVLEALRETALDERDKGDRFERLVLNLLRTEPEWVNRFSDVWLWSEWPGREGRPDTGVDLVAKLRDRDGYAAIQCKFYDPAHRVSKGDLDTFLSASGGREFVSRYFFDTAEVWNGNATETARHQAVPVQRVDIAYLDEAKIDWGQYSWSTPEVMVPLGPKRLRPHQERALADVVSGLETHDRGKLIMACGTGKTFTSLKIAERMVGAGGRVLFLVPSIQLLSQSLREWMQEARGRHPSVRGVLRRTRGSQDHRRRRDLHDRPHRAGDHGRGHVGGPDGGRQARDAPDGRGVLHLPVHRRDRPGATRRVGGLRPGHLRRGAPHHRCHPRGRGRVALRQGPRQRLPARGEAAVHDRHPARVRRGGTAQGRRGRRRARRHERRGHLRPRAAPARVRRRGRGRPAH